jgi:uncharacterized membrane protein YoaK (UPF0700 family)
MGASSVMPARRKDVESLPVSRRDLVESLPIPKRDLAPYIDSLPPDLLQGNSPQSLIRERRVADVGTVSVLSGVAGYVDAFGFLSLVGLLPAHVTGELVAQTTALTAGHVLGHVSRFAVLPLFIVALVIAALVTRSCRRRGDSPRRALLGLMTAALVLCSLSVSIQPAAGTLAFAVVIALREGSAVAAMAFQNAFTREGMASSCPTTVMTGNLTQVSFELVDTLFARLARNNTEGTHARSSSGTRLTLVASALGAFFFGAVMGGTFTGWFGPVSILVPTLVSLLLYLRAAKR